MKLCTFLVVILTMTLALSTPVQARYYQAETGRFLTADPIGLEGGIDPFLYADNNPVNRVDPFGLKVMLCARQAFGGDWSRKHPYYVIPHCYVIAGESIFSWNVQGGGGIHDKENPARNSCSTVNCSCGDEAAFESCVITEAMASQGHEGNLWIPAIHDCCTWAHEVVGKCMRKHCTK